MYPKLFILKEFYFLILDHIINIHLCELLITKTKESKINELKKKKCFTIIIIKNGQFTFNT